ncbi:hypothetical protein NDU88_003353 [Pleurodeles waltl]|uniref:Basic proline-rich protein-like n=1 Tax=Pleurodeles waltl TaxID=8319 RepID=A0AAV7SFX3_PLEWA|nr:hypothetical protein NDU88_003353 [Pleurodeles waltl]
MPLWEAASGSRHKGHTGRKAPPGSGPARAQSIGAAPQLTGQHRGSVTLPVPYGMSPTPLPRIRCFTPRGPSPHTPALVGKTPRLSVVPRSRSASSSLVRHLTPPRGPQHRPRPGHSSPATGGPPPRRYLRTLSQLCGPRQPPQPLDPPGPVYNVNMAPVAPLRSHCPPVREVPTQAGGGAPSPLRPRGICLASASPAHHLTLLCRPQSIRHRRGPDHPDPAPATGRPVPTVLSGHPAAARNGHTSSLLRGREWAPAPLLGPPLRPSHSGAIPGRPSLTRHRAWGLQAMPPPHPEGRHPPTTRPCRRPRPAALRGPARPHHRSAAPRDLTPPHWTLHNTQGCSRGKLDAGRMGLFAAGDRGVRSTLRVRPPS